MITQCPLRLRLPDSLTVQDATPLARLPAQSPTALLSHLLETLRRMPRQIRHNLHVSYSSSLILQCSVLYTNWRLSSLVMAYVG